MPAGIGLHHQHIIVQLQVDRVIGATYRDIQLSIIPVRGNERYCQGHILIGGRVRHIGQYRVIIDRFHPETDP